MNVELARNAASKRPGEAQRLNDIPPNAEYRGSGPLYVWSGEAWLDLHLWMAMNADPRGGEEEEGPKVVELRKPPGREEPATGWLFEEAE